MQHLWKILAALSAIFLLLSGIFSFQNRKALGNEKTLLARAKQNLSSANKRFVEVEDAKLRIAGLLGEGEDDRDIAIKEKAEAEANTAEAQANAATLVRDNADLVAKTRTINDKLEDFSDIEALLAQVNGLKQGIDAAESGIANHEHRLQMVSSKIDLVKEQVESSRPASTGQSQAEPSVPDSFHAHVTSYDPQWKFVILDRGNRQGVVSGARLQVLRAKEPIGEVMIRTVEQNRSVAAVIPETWGDNLPIEGDHLAQAPVAVVEPDPILSSESSSLSSSSDSSNLSEGVLPLEGAGPGTSEIIPQEPSFDSLDSLESEEVIADDPFAVAAPEPESEMPAEEVEETIESVESVDTPAAAETIEETTVEETAIEEAAVEVTEEAEDPFE